MSDTNYSIILFCLFSLFLLVGTMFRKGRWLRLLSGSLNGETPQNEARKVAKFAGITLWIFLLVCLILSAYLIFR